MEAVAKLEGSVAGTITFSQVTLLIILSSQIVLYIITSGIRRRTCGSEGGIRRWP